MQQQQQTPGDWVARNGPGVIYLLIHACATSVEVFLRKDFGPKYLNLQAGIVLILIPLFGLFFPHNDLRPLFWFEGLYLVALALARLQSAARQKRGTSVHSRYSGYPQLWKAFPKSTEQKVKLYGEPAFVWCVAGVIWLFGNNVPLAAYLVLAGVCVHLILAEAIRIQRRQAQQMHDQAIEQQAVAEHFRELCGDQW